MSSTTESIKLWSESAKNFVQIIAIVAGGLWTYQKFIRTEAPSLELRSSVTSNLSIEPSRDGNSCWATFSVSVENTGQSSFDVSTVRIRAWKLDVPRDKAKFAVFADTDAARAVEPFFDKEFASRRLVGHYSPGQKAFSTFQWTLKKWPGLVVFEAELRAQNPPNAAVPLETSRWEDVCEAKK